MINFRKVTEIDIDEIVNIYMDVHSIEEIDMSPCMFNRIDGVNLVVLEKCAK